MALDAFRPCVQLDGIVRIFEGVRATGRLFGRTERNAGEVAVSMSGRGDHAVPRVARLLGAEV